MKMIKPRMILDKSCEDMNVSIPFAPIASDKHSVENLIHFHYLIKIMDHKQWLRAEIFGSVVFVVQFLLIAYIAFQIIFLKLDIYDIGKWDPSKDKSK